MFTIEDLKLGRCAVINDGTIKELNNVLKLAFPDSKLEAMGGQRYYFLHIKLHVKDSIYVWDLDNDTNLPTQSVKDFLPKELKRGDLVWVSDTDPNKRDTKAIYITKAEGANYPYITVAKSDEDNYHAGNRFATVKYLYATRVEGPKEIEMTIEEIEKALNIEGLKIVKKHNTQ